MRTIPSMALLEDQEIAERLEALGGWERKGDEIVREFKLDDFVGSVKFVDAVDSMASAVGTHDAPRLTRFIWR